MDADEDQGSLAAIPDDLRGALAVLARSTAQGSAGTLSRRGFDVTCTPAFREKHVSGGVTGTDPFPGLGR